MDIFPWDSPKCIVHKVLKKIFEVTENVWSAFVTCAVQVSVGGSVPGAHVGGAGIAVL